MKIITTVGIWIYLVVATTIELYVFYLRPGVALTDYVIAAIAAVSAIVTAMFSMNLREESTAVQYLFLIPVLLIAVLILTLLLSFPLAG